jgi:ABC-2 type transport system ATP-binding protein
MTLVLEFQNVSRSYKKGVQVLNDIGFSMVESEVVGLVGRNGAGKTTLINIAMGMLYPSSGSARVFGLSPMEDPVAVKKRVGYVSEDQILPRFASIAEIISLHRSLFPKWDDTIEHDLLDRFKLSLRSRISLLSKGQARQVALICAVCHRPELLILDEPAGGLDPVARREFLETSVRLLNREGTAILFSSHNMTDVERIANRVVLLDGGRIQLDRDVDSIRENICVAIVPRGSAPDASAIERMPGCLRVREAHDDWHAVFDGTLESVHKRLVSVLGHDGFRCVNMPLEELFIELLSGDR